MSFIDTTKFASDDTLIALTGNVQRVHHEPTTHPESNRLTGALSFERIQPRSKHFGMKNITLTYTGTFTIKFNSTSTDRVIRLENINAALYDTTLNINGSIQFTQQPYINYYIKRSYDKAAFQEHQQLYNDKYVFATVSKATADSKDTYTIKYRCCTPIYHSFFESDLVGIDNMSISSQINLNNIFKVISNNKSDLIEANPITVSDSAFKLRYDEIQYTMPLEAYNIQIPHYVYYQSDKEIKPTLTASAEEDKSIQDIATNIRDVRTQPLRVFYSVFPNIRKQDNSVIQCYQTKFETLHWDINNKTNAMNTDSIEDIYLTSRCAGLLTEYETYCGDISLGPNCVSCPPVAAVSMLDTTDSKISTSDLFRLRINANLLISHPAFTAAKTIDLVGYCVYEYPAVLSISNVSSQLIYSLPGTFNELVEMEDDETYLRQLEESGMYGGSKFGDWIKRTWNKIKSGKFISKALNFIGNTKGMNNLLSMIPGVGAAMPVINKIQDIASNAGIKAEDAGYGVNMF